MGCVSGAVVVTLSPSPHEYETDFWASPAIIRLEAFFARNPPLVNGYHDDEKSRAFRGFCSLAIDGPSEPLTDSGAFRVEYGGATGQGTVAMAKVPAVPLDDVLNGIVVEAVIASFHTGEREWARQRGEAFLQLASRLMPSSIWVDRGCPGTSPRTFPLQGVSSD